MTKMEMQYIGAISLLASLSRCIDDQEDLEYIELAIRDCCDLFPDRFEMGPIKLQGFYFRVKGRQA